MNNYEDILSLFKEKFSEKPYVSVWKHFPHLDRKPDSMIKAHIEFQQEIKSDIIKISPHGRYSVADFGCEITNEVDPVTGSPKCKSCRIKDINDWSSIDKVEPQEGELGKQLEVIQSLVKEYSTKTPMIFTIFSPMMIASKLDTDLMNNLNNSPKIVSEGLEIIQQVMEEYIQIILEMGVDGIFLATQHSTASTDIDVFRKHELKSLIELNKMIISREAPLGVILHLHGTDGYFEEIATKLKPAAINWHDQDTSPSLSEAEKIYDGILFGGIDDSQTLRTGTLEEIEDQILKSLNESNKQRTVIAPGCVIPLDVPKESIIKVVELVHTYKY